MKNSLVSSALATFALSIVLATAAVADSPWEKPATPAPAPEVQAPDVEKTLRSLTRWTSTFSRTKSGTA